MKDAGAHRQPPAHRGQLLTCSSLPTKNDRQGSCHQDNQDPQLLESPRQPPDLHLFAAPLWGHVQRENPDHSWLPKPEDNLASPNKHKTLQLLQQTAEVTSPACL